MKMLQDRVVWVVGASGTIGSALSFRLAQEGALVVASGRSPGKLQLVCDRIAGAGHRARPHQVDILDARDVQRAADAIAGADGQIDGLVNCTSISVFGDFLGLTDANWLEVIDTKLLGYARTARAVLPHMLSRQKGVIVNISGRSGRQPTSTHLPGGCANAAINLLSKGLSDAYKARGIRVNAIAPGPIVSPRLDKLLLASAAGAAPAATPNAGSADDIAQVVLWLMSDASRHLTGTVIAADGGATAAL